MNAMQIITLIERSLDLVGRLYRRFDNEKDLKEYTEVRRQVRKAKVALAVELGEPLDEEPHPDTVFENDTFGAHPDDVGGKAFLEERDVSDPPIGFDSLPDLNKFSPLQDDGAY